MRISLLVVFQAVVDEGRLEHGLDFAGLGGGRLRFTYDLQHFTEPVVGHEDQRHAKRLPGIGDHVDRAVRLASLHLADAGRLAAGPLGDIVQSPVLISGKTKQTAADDAAILLCAWY
jgi:hypothetical protein